MILECSEIWPKGPISLSELAGVLNIMKCELTSLHCRLQNLSGHAKRYDPGNPSCFMFDMVEQPLRVLVHCNALYEIYLILCRNSKCPTWNVHPTTIPQTRRRYLWDIATSLVPSKLSLPTPTFFHKDWYYITLIFKLQLQAVFNATLRCIKLWL